MGFTFNGWWALFFFYLTHSNGWFFEIPFMSFCFFVFFNLAVPFCPWLEFAQFSFKAFYLLIWHVVLMQNDKTGACGCVCDIFQSVNDSVCACLCVNMQKRAVYRSDWIPTCFIVASYLSWLCICTLLICIRTIFFLFCFCASQKTHWYTLSFPWFYIGVSFFQFVFLHNDRLLHVYVITGSSLSIHSCTYRGQNICIWFR